MQGRWHLDWYDDMCVLGDCYWRKACPCSASGVGEGRQMLASHDRSRCGGGKEGLQEVFRASPVSSGGKRGIFNKKSGC